MPGRLWLRRSSKTSAIATSLIGPFFTPNASQAAPVPRPPQPTNATRMVLSWAAKARGLMAAVARAVTAATRPVVCRSSRRDTASWNSLTDNSPFGGKDRMGRAAIGNAALGQSSRLAQGGTATRIRWARTSLSLTQRGRELQNRARRALTGAKRSLSTGNLMLKQSRTATPRGDCGRPGVRPASLRGFPPTELGVGRRHKLPGQRRQFRQRALYLA